MRVIGEIVIAQDPASISTPMGPASKTLMNCCPDSVPMMLTKRSL
jgi:hypothetical protein